jgi:hypothetical protein
MQIEEESRSSNVGLDLQLGLGEIGMRRSVITVIVVALVVALGGCSGPQQGEAGDEVAAESTGVFMTNEGALAFAKEHGYDTMSRILEDGVVTRDEYVESYNAYESCAEAAGYKFAPEPASWNPTDNLSLSRTVVGQPSGEVLVALQDCNLQHAHIANEFSATQRPRTDPPLFAFVLDCLGNQVVEVPSDGEENFVELAKLNPGLYESQALPDCVGKGMSELYPEVDAYALVF